MWRDKSIVTQDFIGEQPPARPIGIEMEYQAQGVSYVDLTSNDTIEAAGYMHSGPFLENGAKYYPDVFHAEYAGPEALGPEEGGHTDLAGIKVVGRMALQCMGEDGAVYRVGGTYIPVFDRNGILDVSGETSGYHENYLIPRFIGHDPTLVATLPAFLGSRIWSGSGTIRDQFVFMQKMWGIGNTISRDYVGRTGHGVKPMCLIPPVYCDEDVIADSQWVRAEVRCMDPGQSPLIRYLALAATSLYFRLIEHQNIVEPENIKRFALMHSVQSAKIFAGDLTLKWTQPTRYNEQFNALDIQEGLMELVAYLNERVELPADEVRALPMIIKLIQSLRNTNPQVADYGNLVRIFDFAARHYNLAQKFGVENITNSDEHKDAMHYNLIWDRIYPEGFAQKWWKAFPTKLMKDAKTDEYVYEPPQDTRAYERVQTIRHQNNITSIKWAGALLGPGEHQVVF